jgi:hypothetical protein
MRRQERAIGPMISDRHARPVFSASPGRSLADHPDRTMNMRTADA